jgi:hypothetical protein
MHRKFHLSPAGSSTQLNAKQACQNSLSVASSKRSRLEAARNRGVTLKRLLTLLAGRNLPKIQQPRESEPSIINEKTLADFTRVVEQTGILSARPQTDEPVQDDKPRLVERDLKAKKP